MLAKLITAMTREGKFKDAIQDRIGATVDTSDLEKQLSVLNANLHQAETIKTRLEQQMDNLDVTDIHLLFKTCFNCLCLMEIHI